MTNEDYWGLIVDLDEGNFKLNDEDYAFIDSLMCLRISRGTAPTLSDEQRDVLISMREKYVQENEATVP